MSLEATEILRAGMTKAADDLLDATRAAQKTLEEVTGKLLDEAQAAGVETIYLAAIIKEFAERVQKGAKEIEAEIDG